MSPLSPPSPWQPPIYSLCLQICLLEVPHVSGIRKYLSSCDWLPLLGVNVLKVHPRCSRGQNRLPFEG